MKSGLVCAWICCMITVWATPAAAQARAGIHGGLSSSALIMDSGDSGFRKSFIGGGWVRFPLAGAVGLQLGAYYAQKGSSDSGEGFTAEVQLKYIELPLLLAFLFNRAGEVSGYLATGGAFAVQRGCQVSASVQGASASIDCDATDVNGIQPFDAEKFDVGFVLGTGLEIDRGPIILTFDLRSNFGLMEAFSIYPQGSELDSDSGQNLSLAFMAGVAFPLGARPPR